MMTVTFFTKTLVACSLFLATQAQETTVSLFPVGFSSDIGFEGEAVGTGSLGTTYVLSAETDSIPFTLTLVQNPSQVVEGFSIPSLSLDVQAACILTSGSSNNNAICQQVVEGGQAGETQTITNTMAFSPFAVEVSPGSALPSQSGSGGGLSSGLDTTSRSQSTITALSTSTTGTSGGAQPTESSRARNGKEMLMLGSFGAAFAAALGLAFII